MVSRFHSMPYRTSIYGLVELPAGCPVRAGNRCSKTVVLSAFRLDRRWTHSAVRSARKRLARSMCSATRSWLASRDNDVGAPTLTQGCPFRATRYDQRVRHIDGPLRYTNENRDTARPQQRKHHRLHYVACVARGSRFQTPALLS